jgi:hypothetical protein
MRRAVLGGVLMVVGLACVAIGLGLYFSQTGVGGIESNPSFSQVSGNEVALVPIVIGALLIVAGFEVSGARASPETG